MATKEELETLNKELAAKVEALEQQVGEVTKERDSALENLKKTEGENAALIASANAAGDVNAQVTALQKKLTAAEEQLLEAGIMNDTLQDKLESASKHVQVKPQVEIDGKLYVIRFAKMEMADGKTVTADDIKADPSLGKALLEMGSRALVEAKQ